MILHRQGTQPRLIDSSEHSSINLNLRKRNSTLFERLSDVSHVHRSPHHRGRRASPPRRFVCAGCLEGNWTAAGTAVGLAVVVWGPDGVGRSARSAPRRRFFGTISFGLQPSGSSSQPSPRRFQTSSLRRPPVGPPHRWPGAQLSNEGLHRLSCTSFPTPSSPSRFPTSQVRLPRLARPCMNGHHGGLGHPGTGRD